jgi:DNA replication protein DnaC
MSVSELADRLGALNLSEAARCLPELVDDATRSGTSAVEFLDRLLMLEYQAREERRLAMSLKLSGLPKGMRLETFDYLFQPSVEKQRIDALASCQFIKNRENVLFFGQPGVGKTHLAVSLGVRAIELGFSTIHYTVEELLAHLKKRSDIPLSSQRRQPYIKNALVVLDELGYQCLDRNETHLLFQFIAARYLKGSLIITSNRSVKDWVDIFSGDQMATTAILDRLLHRAHIFMIDGRSYRLKDYATFLKEGQHA